MSATALPITSSRFAAALRELPISSLHAKVSELQNSIAHLEKSNVDLEEFVRTDGDKDCYEALMENRDVIEKNKERIELIRKEVVELRGLPWEADEKKTVSVTSETGLNGTVRSGSVESNAAANSNATTSANVQSQEHANGAAAEPEEGVYL